MKTAQGTTLITNGQLIDGNGNPPVPNAALIIKDGRIAYAGPSATAPRTPPDALHLDARGGSILPGLVEAHYHATYFNVSELQDLDIKYPVEYITLLAAANAKLTLECGYTAARSGGCLHNVDVWLKKAIEDDLVPGPRLAASGREICGAGGLMDWNPDFRKIGMEGLVFIVNGPEDGRRAVRKLVKDGIEWVKTYPTGDAAAPDVNDHHTLCMTFEEMHAVVAEAHNHRMKVTGHCRATEGIKNALRAGYDTIEHGTFMDDEALELLLKRNTPVIPALQFELASVKRGPEFNLGQAVIDGHQETLDAGCESARVILKAGGRLGMGGDYGFAWNPHGDYAKELTFFVKYVGFSALDTIKCATRTGAEILGREKEIGTLEAGKLADVLLVDGDPVADISILENRQRFLAVMQGGIIKAGQGNECRRRFAQPATRRGDAVSLTLQKYSGQPALCYLEGPKAGPPLLLLHGVGRCAEDYREFAARLEAHWHVRALDFRGHGGSDRTPDQYLVTDYVRDTVAFVQDEVLQPVVIYGHSLGAMVALAVAAALPGQVRGVVLEDPPFHTMGQRITQTPWQALFMGMRDVARSASGIDNLAVALAELAVPVPGQSGLAKLGKLRGTESLRFSARCLAQLDPEVFTPVIGGRWLDGYDERELYKQVRCPALLLQGDSSAGGALLDDDADAAMAALAACRRVRFPRVGHLIHQDQPAAALRALQEFATTLPSKFPNYEKTSSLSAVSRV